MGLLSVQVSRVCGAGKVIVVGLDTDIGRMEIAQEMGADGIINAQDPYLGFHNRLLMW